MESWVSSREKFHSCGGNWGGMYGGWRAPLVGAKTLQGGCWMTYRHSFSPQGVNCVCVREKLPVNWYLSETYLSCHPEKKKKEADEGRDRDVFLFLSVTDRHKHWHIIGDNNCWTNIRCIQWSVCDEQCKLLMGRAAKMSKHKKLKVSWWFNDNIFMISLAVQYVFIVATAWVILFMVL